MPAPLARRGQPPSPPSPPMFSYLPQPSNITMWHNAAGFNQSSQTWQDWSPAGNWTATAVGVTASTSAPNTFGAANSMPVVSGTGTSTVSFMYSVVLPFTACSLERYTGTSNNTNTGSGGRIVVSRNTSPQVSWILGHCSDSANSGRYAGIILASCWTTVPQDNGNGYTTGVYRRGSYVYPNTNWVLACLAVDINGVTNAYVNGVNQNVGTDGLLGSLTTPCTTGKAPGLMGACSAFPAVSSVPAR